MKRDVVPLGTPPSQAGVGASEEDVLEERAMS
jgi:hypothetical protein